MNRRQKIIISVTGIFLVLLILVGLTYAFFLTRIKGNENPTSISVTTANLELTYKDADDANIIGEGMVIEPNTVIGEKTFTVTNSGNVTIDNYGVIIENLAVKYVETQTIDGVIHTAGEVTSLVNGEDDNPDMKLVITCTSSVEGKTCAGMDGYLPEKSNILLTNSIDEAEVHTYTATLTYLDDGTNQSSDMNKTIEGRFNIIDMNNTVDIEGTVTGYNTGDFVQINSEEKESVIYPDGTYKFVGVKPDDHKITVRYKDQSGNENLRGNTLSLEIVKGNDDNISENIVTITDKTSTLTVNIDVNSTELEFGNINPYPFESLAYNIIINAKTTSKKMSENLGNAIYSETPLTTPAESINIDTEATLSLTEDDYGNSYYYRGNVTNNYINFADMCWRIVRIAGDGSVKLILEDQDEVCSTTMNGDWYIEASDGTSITNTYRTGNFGYDDSTGKYKMSYLNPVDNPNRAMVNAFKYFQTNTLTNKITSNYTEKTISDFLVSGNWCLNNKAYNDTIGTTLLENPTYTSSFYYDSYVRLYGKTTKEPTLKCPVETMGTFGDNTTPMYVGTITADEIVYAGGKVGSSTPNYYLINKWQNSNSKYFWSLSPYYFNGNRDYAFGVGYYGDLNYNEVAHSYFTFRPSVSLKSGSVITEGEGTLEKPYVIG